MARRSCTLLFLIVVLCACKRGSGNSDRVFFGSPSPTVPPTQTPFIVRITTTPLYTYTPVVQVVTSTPQPGYLCVTADENVNLRPSASDDNYPITPLPRGTRLTDLGGREGSWAFVQYGELSGWVHLKYLENCK